MLIKKNQVKQGLDDMSRSLTELLTSFALAGYALLGEAIRIRQDPTMGTAGTDGRNITYNPEFWSWMEFDDRVFVLLHEFLHVFYGHPERLRDRDQKIWNIACDIVVNAECNQILKQPIPPYAIPLPTWYRHGEMTADEVYDRLISSGETPEGKPTPFDGNELPNGGDMSSPPPEEAESDKKEWVERLRSDLAQAQVINEQAGHADKVPAGMTSRLEKISRGTIPFDRLFRGSLQQLIGHDVADWSKPSKKASWSRTVSGMRSFTLPSFRARKERKLLILVDVSASVRQERLNRFASNIENASKQATEIHIATFDQEVRERYRTDRPGTVLRNIKLLMGHHGYTDARPAFAIAEELDPSAIACFTDGFIYLPDKPYRQTLFVRPPPPEGKALPWGREFVMEELF